MKLIFRPTTGPDDWKQFLAEPEKQWKPGYSAHSLAHCWERADGLPESVRTVFQASSVYRDFERLLAIPELKVDLPGGSRPSQTDLWLLGRVPDGLVHGTHAYVRLAGSERCCPRHARHAVMVVHSFSGTDLWLQDYQAFLKALGCSGDAGRVIEVPSHSDPTLSLAWVAERVTRRWRSNFSLQPPAGLG